MDASENRHFDVAVKLIDSGANLKKVCLKANNKIAVPNFIHLMPLPGMLNPCFSCAIECEQQIITMSL